MTAGAPPSSVSRLRARGILVAVSCVLAGAAVTGCSASVDAPRPAASARSTTPAAPTPHAVGSPNASDAARLHALAADPLLHGAVVTAARVAPGGSADFNLTRGKAATVRMTGKTPYATVPIANAHAELAKVRAAGWTVVAVQCLVDPTLTSAQIYAVKDLGGFTASLTESISSSALTTVAYAPYHAEKPNPWFPGADAAPTATCIDGPAAPKDTTESVATDIGEKALI